jgi:hypothetical protein
MKLLSGHGIRMIERWCVFESAILMITNPFHIFSDFLSIISDLFSFFLYFLRIKSGEWVKRVPLPR